MRVPACPAPRRARRTRACASRAATTARTAPSAPACCAAVWELPPAPSPRARVAALEGRLGPLAPPTREGQPARMRSPSGGHQRWSFTHTQQDGACLGYEGQGPMQRGPRARSRAWHVKPRAARSSPAGNRGGGWTAGPWLQPWLLFVSRRAGAPGCALPTRAFGRGRAREARRRASAGGEPLGGRGRAGPRVVAGCAGCAGHEMGSWRAHMGGRGIHAEPSYSAAGKQRERAGRREARERPIQLGRPRATRCGAARPAAAARAGAVPLWPRPGAQAPAAEGSGAAPPSPGRQGTRGPRAAALARGRVTAAASAAGRRLLLRSACGGCSRRPSSCTRPACPPTAGGPGGSRGVGRGRRVL